MNSKKLKTKSKEQLDVSDKYVYRETIYQMYKNGFSLFREKLISSEVPLKKLSKDQFMKVYKNYKLMRCLDLEAAPENYLIQNGYDPRHC